VNVPLPLQLLHTISSLPGQVEGITPSPWQVLQVSSRVTVTVVRPVPWHFAQILLSIMDCSSPCFEELCS